jgi:hypothetical protein
MVSPSSVTRGSTFQVSGSVTSPTVRTVVVKYEIRSAFTSAMVTSQSYTAQIFTAGQTRTYTTPFVIPTSAPAGTYRVDTLIHVRLVADPALPQRHHLHRELRRFAVASAAEVPGGGGSRCAALPRLR